jgi:gluconokinase
MAERTPEQVVIGLDVGTTGVKAVAFGVGSSWDRVAIRDQEHTDQERGRYEQDPASVIAATAGALAECVSGLGAGEVVGISVSTAMHGLVALDGERRPITPLLTWADGRAADEARSLHRSGQAADLHGTTGAPVHPMTPLTKLMWFAGHDPDTWAAAQWWVGLKELVLLWLTGELATELSAASGTGLLDMATRSWSPLALDVCGLDAGRLPEILPTTATRPLGPVAAREVGLPAGLPVVVGAGDGPLGNLGTGAITPGIAGLTLGTSGAVRTAVPEPCVDDRRTLFCYALTDSLWVIGGAVSNGAGALRWAGSSLAPDLADDDAVLDLAAGVPAGSDGLVMLPYVLPERAPLWDPDLRGAYLGLHGGHTRGHLVRAMVEGVCLQLRLVLDGLAEVAPVTSVRATGGAFGSPLWREVMAAAIGRPLHVMDGSEGTARGAAALGLVALGEADTLEAGLALLSDDSTPPPVETDPDTVAVYDRLRASIPTLVADLTRVAAAHDPVLGT